MKNIFKSIWAVLIFIFGIIVAIFSSSRKPEEIKKLDKVIKENKKAEKKTEEELRKLQEDKEANKREIANLKRKITRTKKEIEKMEDAYNKDNVDDAVKFLKKFAGS